MFPKPEIEGSTFITKAGDYTATNRRLRVSYTLQSSVKVVMHFTETVPESYTVRAVGIQRLSKACHIQWSTPQFKKVWLGSEVGSKIDQNEPLRLGFTPFASKLMDCNSIKVFAFNKNQSPKNWKTEMDGVRFMIPSGDIH